MNPQALEAAIQVLAAGVTGLTAQIAQMNAANSGADLEGWLIAIAQHTRETKEAVAAGGGGAGAPAAKPAAGGLLSGFGRVLAQFAAVAGPMAVLGAVMGSVTSGMSTLGKAAQLLGTVLSPVLLPAAVLLGTAFVAAADLIEGAGAPALQGFFTLVLGIGIPALVTFFDIVVSVSQKLGEWYEWLRKNTGGGEKKTPAEETADDTYKRIFDEEREKLRKQDFRNEETPWTPQYTDIINEATRRADERVARGDTGATAERPKIEATVFNALRDVAGSLRMSVGPRAQIGGLEGIGRAAQLAALNQDPIEARMLKVQQRIADALDGAIAELTRARGGVYVPPTDRLRTAADGARALEAGRAARPDRGG